MPAALKMSIDELEAFLAEVFPQLGGHFEILEVEPYRAVVAMNAAQAQLRPGGTVSGPTLFALADLSFYVATLALIGPEALTVTSNASINFLRKPPPGRLTAEARVLKLGRSASVGDVLIRSDAAEGPVAHAAVTYAIPPRAAEVSRAG